MVFFRLGKIDRGEKVEKAEKKDPESPKDEPKAGVAGSKTGDPTTPSATAEKEAKKKNKKETESTSGSAPSTASASDQPGSGATPVARSQTGLSVNDFISKTKNQQRQGLKPSGPELIAYARYLGIEPMADHDLLWIAVEALEAPLPSDWTEHFDSNDRVFYYNATMRVSSWTHPLEHIYRETYKTIVNYRNANMSLQERTEKLHQLQLEVKQMEHDVKKEIAQWTEHQDEQGNRFYFNREERQSTWTDPRPAKCQILYLRMKMLRLLQFSAGGTQGFADNKASAYNMFSTYDYDDPAFKRPKVNSSRQAAESTAHERGGRMWPNQAASDVWSEAETSSVERNGDRASSPSSPGSGNGTDTESDDERTRRKKKKKKKKKSRRDSQMATVTLDAASAAAPPPGMGGQRMRNSQSEPNVGGKPILGNVDEVRGGLGLQQTSTPQNLALNLLDHPSEGLTTVGRARIKAGIRLEPLGGGGSPAETSTKTPGQSPPSGSVAIVKNSSSSASVPTLQP
eukprot:TRINITY_DN26964_c0_g1_i1.p1 TRINITY_DN26964_c0_g1~~TRINITY_DN26964_c0_g1_i1.p1  ORF type:complete len:513 (+),score=106.09 TRINITY_DN26964_c0_g1_i1:205-1743(+)